jgi:N-acetylneuraminic acid mutarotase
MKTILCVIGFAAAVISGPATAESDGSDDERNHYILCEFKCDDAIRWVPTGKMNVARAGHTATVLADGKVLVVGGGNDSPDAIDSSELYDPASRSWSYTGRLNVARAGHTATQLADGRVLVAGGFSHGGCTRTAEVYDPETGVWTLTGGMSAVRCGHSATLLQNGRVLVAGNETAEVYDPAADNWSRTGRFNFARSGHTAIGLLDGRVLVFGGQWGYDPWGGDGVNYDVATAELYDPIAGVWIIAPSSSVANGSATLLLSGKVLVAGGRIDNLPRGPMTFAASELFDPEIGAWTQTMPLGAARSGHTTTLLSNGSVLVAGGFQYLPALYWEFDTVDSVERFEPNAASWTKVSSLNTARTGHTANLLADGTVLVAGGYCVTEVGNTGILLDTAELLGPVE